MALSIEHNIFPDLSPRTEIFEKISLLEKGWLDRARLSIPSHLVSLISDFRANNYRFFHIKGVQADYNEKNCHLESSGINLNLLGAAYNQFFPLLYVVLCHGGSIEVFFGTREQSAPALTALLETIAGPSLYKESGPDSRLNLITGYKQGAALTGVPTSFEVKNRFLQKPGRKDTGTDMLISGLMREHWAYIVQAFPVERRQTSDWLESCARETKDIKEAFLNREFQKSNRMAAYYVDVLEKSVKRLSGGTQQGLWQTGVYLLAGKAETVSRGAALLSSIFSGDRSSPEPVRTHICSNGTEQTAFINNYNTGELKAFMALPGREYGGFRLQERIEFDVDFAGREEDSLAIGTIMNGDHITGQTCSIPVADLTKHGLVAGVTGSGKTTTLFSMLSELYNRYKIPFLVIEPAKSEYRDLMKEIDQLLVFTLGEERPGLSAPFRLNPFVFPDGVSLQTHIDFLKAVFHASFVMYAPMPYVLEECLYKIYEDKGWNLVSSDNTRGHGEIAFPTLSDLHRKIDDVAANLGYQDRTTMDIKAALKTRIKNLCLGGKGMMLNTSSSVSFREIMKRPTVLELKYLGNDEEKAFMMGLILMSLYEYYEGRQGRGGDGGTSLAHLTVIEEAHRLLKNVPTEKSSEEQNNIKGMGVETFSNLLAEIRAYGEGVLVSEQIPSKLATDVIKNSNLKIMHRLVAKEDRELMGAAMNLDQRQQREIVSLQTGRAACFREGMDRPVKIMMPLAAGKASGRKVSDMEVHKNMISRFYRHQHTLLMKFPACGSCPHSGRDCERVKKEVEEIRSSSAWEEERLRFFLPWLLDPDRGIVKDHLQSVFFVQENSGYCLTAHLINDYVKAKGDYDKWRFDQITALVAEAQKNIVTNKYPQIIASYCNSEKTRGRYAVCEDFCPHKCLFCYEGNVMAGDPYIHNRLIDLLDSAEYGTRFYLELVTMLGEYFQDVISDDHRKYIGTLGLCYLIQKLNSLRFSQPLQRRIVAEFVRVTKKLT